MSTSNCGKRRAVEPEVLDHGSRPIEQSLGPGGVKEAHIVCQANLCPGLNLMDGAVCCGVSTYHVAKDAGGRPKIVHSRWKSPRM